MKYLYACLLVFLSIAVKSQDSIIVFHKKAPLPAIARVECGYFAIDSNIYIIGGLDSIGYFHKDIWKYNIPSDTWSQMGNFPFGRIEAPGSFAIQGKGYICSGTDSQGIRSKRVCEYDPSSDTWTRKSDFPGLGRNLPNCFTYNDKGYLGFGYGFGNDLWQYDPLADHWIEMDTFPSDPRYGISVGVIDSFAYFIGGKYRIIYQEETSEVWRFHLLTNKWEQVANIPGSGRGFGPIWGIGHILLSGYGTHIDTALYYQQTDKYYYNSLINSWHTIEFQNFVDSTADGVSLVTNNTEFYFGGDLRTSPFSYSNDLYSFDLAPFLTTGIEEPKPNTPAISIHPNPVFSHAILTLSSQRSGEVQFYNSIGQMLYTSHLDAGTNHISCDLVHTEAGVIFYRAALHDGSVENGKVVVY